MTVIDIHTHMIPRRMAGPAPVGRRRLRTEADTGRAHGDPSRRRAVRHADAGNVRLRTAAARDGRGRRRYGRAVADRAQCVLGHARGQRQGRADRQRRLCREPDENIRTASAGSRRFPGRRRTRRWPNSRAPAPTARSASQRSPTSAGATWAIRCSRRSGRRSTGWASRCSSTRRFRPAAATCGSTNSAWRRRSASWSTPRSPSRG